MSFRRSTAGVLTIFFLTLPFAGLVGASTEPTYDGDVIVNGDFADASKMGHPLKGNDPASTWVAYDWTGGAAGGATATFEPASPGLWMNKTSGGPSTDAYVQQHFNGSFGTSRLMGFHGAEFVLSSAAPGVGVELYLRYRDADGTNLQTIRSATLDTTPATFQITPADVGVAAGTQMSLVSTKVVVYADASVLLHRVSVYATNGVEGRNLHILPAGDDAVTVLGNAALVSPGADGKYSFLAGFAADDGDFLPTTAVWACLYTGERAIEDRGYPANNGTTGMCRDAYLKPDSPAITTTRAGNGFRIDIAASAVDPAADSKFPAFALFVTVKAPDRTSLGDPSVYKSGYFHLARVAADQANRNVSSEYYGPTPIFVDGNADGRPDYAQTQDMDGYSVVLTPRLATTAPGLAVITTDTNGEYAFEAQVYKYEGATGAPIPVPNGFSMGIFDASGLVGGTYSASPLWKSEGRHVTRLDATTFLVRIPASELPSNTPLGAWGFYNLGEKSTSPFGTFTGTTDFFSTVRNAVKDYAVADGMRTAATPFILDGSSVTRDATVVIRMVPDADALAPLDGTILAAAGADGTVSFEYALVYPDGAREPNGGSHALAIYDAAGVASDDLQPGSRALRHAEHVAVGTPTGDGWFRVDVPLSAFDEAKGAVGAWAYVDDRHPTGYVLSRSGWFNVLKAEAAAVSTSAAEKALYEPTPIVILDQQLGIPAALSSTLKASPAGILSVQNPVVNPGFEADLLVEGRNDQDSAFGGTMTSPPWFFRLDDSQSDTTDPISIHEVVPGAGRTGDRALKVHYDAVDRPYGLMLGQLLGSEEGALVWNGASGVAFDIKTTNARPLPIVASLRYLAADGTIGWASQSKVIEHTSGWQRVTYATPVPADAQLLGVYFTPTGGSGSLFYLDNVAITGSKTALGDTRTDLSDGYAMIITPQDMAQGQQLRVAGASGEFYLYEVEVADYTGATPSTLDLAGLARSFGYRVDTLTKDVGTTLALRGDDGAFVAAVPVADVPETPAAPWAWVHAGDVYSPFGMPYAMQPASGYYSPVKNALAGAAVADQLDYAGTPVVFGAEVSRELVFPQSIRLTDVAGGYGIIVEADSPFVETTTVTITRGGEVVQTLPVTLASDEGDVVPGAFIAAADVAATTIETADTAFTTGMTLLPGEPTASFEFCRPGFEGCLDIGVLTNELLTFRSTSVSPAGESLTLVWDFGDGTTLTETDDTTTHEFTRPGAKTVTLTVSTASGKRASAEREIVVNNRAPEITKVVVSPSGPIAVTDNVALRALASDADGGSLLFSWTVEGWAVPGVTSASLRLTPSILENATGNAQLERRTYSVGVSVSDGQGGVDSAVATFTVVDRPADVSAPEVGVVGFPDATYVIQGETLAFAVDVTDADGDVPSTVTLELVDNGTVVLSTLLAANATGAWVGQASTATLVNRVHEARAVAVFGAVGITGAATPVDVRSDLPPVVNATGPALVEVGGTASFAAVASDPDGRGIAGIAWFVGGVQVATGAAPNLTFEELGEFPVSARATDVTGALGEAVVNVIVDDRIVVELSVEESPTTPDGAYVVLARVLRWDGTPVAGALVLFEDSIEPLPYAYQNAAFETDAAGEARYEVEAELGFTYLGLPHRIVAKATAASVAAAPVQDAETASASMLVGGEQGPLAGLPLP